MHHRSELEERPRHVSVRSWPVSYTRSKDPHPPPYSPRQRKKPNGWLATFRQMKVPHSPGRLATPRQRKIPNSPGLATFPRRKTPLTVQAD